MITWLWITGIPVALFAVGIGALVRAMRRNGAAADRALREYLAVDPAPDAGPVHEPSRRLALVPADDV
jgi:hypothetical protein